MPSGYPNREEAQSIALSAIGWIVSDARRAERFLGLTGLDPAELREGIGEAGVQAAGLDFLLAHEPDLIACANALDLAAGAIVDAREELAR